MKKQTKFFRPKVPQKLKNLTWPQTKERFPLIKTYGDADNDGVKNYRDCKPFDMKRQGEGHMLEEDYGFRFVYKKGGKKKEAQTAEELIEELN